MRRRLAESKSFFQCTFTAVSEIIQPVNKVFEKRVVWRDVEDPFGEMMKGATALYRKGYTRSFKPKGDVPVLTPETAKRGTKTWTKQMPIRANSVSNEGTKAKRRTVS